MLNKICKVCFVSIITILPLFSSAVYLTKTTGILTGAEVIVTEVLIPLMFTLALVLFFWGIVKYIWSEGTGKEEGRKIMIWGVIALFVMSSIWGIVYFMRSELNIGSEKNMPIPTIGSGYNI